MTDAVKFQLGDRVKHKVSDDDDSAGIVTGITFRPGGISYDVSWGPHGESSHYDIELEAEPETAKA